MYLPRNLISHLYNHLLRTHHPLSPPVLLLVALEPDALCACRILTALLKRDYIPHKIQPISGYSDLARAGDELVRPMRTTDGGSGGVVVCLGVGGMCDLEEKLGLEVDESGEGGMGGVDVWVLDARRPWHLTNVFGGQPVPVGEAEQNGEIAREANGVDQGRVLQSYRPGRGGIVVFDDGDIEEELVAERDAYCALAEMPEIGEDADEDYASETDEDDEGVPDSAQDTRKRKSPSDREDGSESEDDDDRPRQRRRSNSSSPIPSSPNRPARHGLLSTSHHRRNSSDFSRSGSPMGRSGSISRSTSPVHASKRPSARTLRNRLLRLRRKHDAVLRSYYSLGTSYSEPISSLMYSLASELGREDNDLLWHAIVGVSSLELSGRTITGLGLSSRSTSSGWRGSRGERIRAVLRDEVRRLNPTDLKDLTREANLGDAGDVIQTHARSPTDTAIRLSPEPRFLLIRHWSLYDSMLHSPYLAARLHIWSDAGRRRLHKLLAKMGVSLSQCKQSYTHMDMELKRGLRERLLRFAPMYGLEGLVPPPAGRAGGKEGWGFVRCWGWKACLSAVDMGVVVGAILEVGDMCFADAYPAHPDAHNATHGRASYNSRIAGGSSDTAAPPNASDAAAVAAAEARQEAVTARFWSAYDALASPTLLASHIPTAQHLHRAILRTGTQLVAKKQIRHLRAFRMAVVKEGPDVALFTHAGALTKLALWVAEAVAEMEGGKGGGRAGGELVMAGLDEARGVYVVVGLGGGAADVAVGREREAERKKRREEKERRREEKRAEGERWRAARANLRAANGDSDDEDEDETEEEASDSSASESEAEGGAHESRSRGHGRNRFGNAFQEAVEETGARVKVDSFEHCVVEVKKEDLSGFLESLSMKAVVG